MVLYRYLKNLIKGMDSPNNIINTRSKYTNRLTRVLTRVLPFNWQIFILAIEYKTFSSLATAAWKPEVYKIQCSLQIIVKNF